MQKKNLATKLFATLALTTLCSTSFAQQVRVTVRYYLPNRPVHVAPQQPRSYPTYPSYSGSNYYGGAYSGELRPGGGTQYGSYTSTAGRGSFPYTAPYGTQARHAQESYHTRMDFEANMAAQRAAMSR